MIVVVDKHQRAQTILTNSSPKALGYFADAHKEQLDGLLTYEFSTPANHPSAKHLIAGNSVIVRNLDKALMKFQILRTEESQQDGKYIRRVYAENAAVGDLYSEVVRGSNLGVVGVEQAAKHILQGTGWKVGRVEYAGLESFDFRDYPTVLAALYTIRDRFGLELEFTVHFNGVKVQEQFVHFVKKRGQVTHKRFTYGKDLTDVVREEDRSDLVTALIGVGKAQEDGSRLTFTDHEAWQNGYFKPKGQEWVGDEAALQMFGNNGKHIFGRAEFSNIDNVYDLLDKTTLMLKRVSKPLVNYKINVILLERLTGYEHEKVRLGDTIIVKDTTFEPALIVEARVIELVRSYTDPTQDAVTLGEFVPIFVDSNAQIEAIQKQINDNIAKWEQSGERILKSHFEPKEKEKDMLWLDLSVVPNVMKRWDEELASWVKSTPTTAGEVGAETPEGAQDKANQAEENAKSYVEGVVEEVETSMRDHAEQVAKNAEESAKLFTEGYAEKELHIGDKPPEDKSRLWLDTTNKLNVLKRYNIESKEWEAATPTTAEEVGAETPSGALEKARQEAEKAQAAAIAEANKKTQEAEEAANKFTQEITKDIEANANQHAEDRAKAAEEAAKTFTQSYAQKEIKQQNTAPTDTSSLWLDTSKEPNILKRYDATAKKWVNASPTSASQIGGETPEGAKAKADAAQKAAEEAAKKEAAAQAALAETNAKAHADGKVSAEEAARIAQAEANLAAAKKEAADKAAAAEKAAKEAAAIDAANKAAAAQAAAIAEAQKKAEAAKQAAITAAAADAKAKADAAEKAATDRANTVETTVKEFASNAGNITKGTIAAERLYGGTIDAQKANIVNINAGNITTGSIDASKIKVTNIDAGAITAGTLNAARLAAGTITADKLHVLAKNLVANTSTTGNDSTGWNISKHASSTIGLRGSGNMGDVLVHGFTTTAHDTPTLYNSNYFEVDPNQTYKFSIGMYLANNTRDASQYFGFNAYDKNMKELPVYFVNPNGTNIDPTERTNPYFWSGNAASDSWRMMDGYVMSSQGQANDCPAGRNVNQNFKMHPATKYLRMRFYSGYYPKVNNAAMEVLWHSPSVTSVDSGTFTAEKIVAGTIDATKISVINLNAGNVTTGTLDANKVNVTNLKAQNIVSGTLDASKITVANLSASVLQTGVLDASKVTVNNLDASKITTGTLSADKVKGGTIDANNVNIVNLKAGNIASGTIDASKIAVTNLNAGNITAGTISAARIAAHTITSDKLVISDFTNLCPNPDFKDGISGGWSNVTAIDATNAAVPTGAPTKFVGKQTVRDGLGSDHFNVRAGDQFYVSADIASKNSVKEFTLGVYFYDKNGGAVAATGSGYKNKGTGVWQRHEGMVTAPANAALARVWTQINAFDTFGEWFVTNVVVRRKAGAELIVDGAITTNKINAAGISADKITTGTLNASKVAVTNLSASVIQTGVLDAAKVQVNNLSASRITTGTMSADRITGGSIDANAVNIINLKAQNIASGTINADKVTISNGKVTINSAGVTVSDSDFLVKDARTGFTHALQSQTNLIKDHSFELLAANVNSNIYDQIYVEIDPSYVNRNPIDGWMTVGTPMMVDGYSFDSPDDASAYGRKAVRCNTNNYVWTDFSAKASKQYSISFYSSKPYYMTTTAAPQVQVEYIKDGNVVSSEVKNFPQPSTAAGQYVRYGFTITTPAGINGRFNRVRLRFRANNYDYIMYDGIQAVQGNRAVPYDSEDSLFLMSNNRLTPVRMSLRNLLMMGNTRIEAGGLSIAGVNANGVGLEMSQPLKVWNKPIEVVNDVIKTNSHMSAYGFQSIGSRPAGTDRMLWLGWHEQAGNALYAFISGAWRVVAQL
ncbi:phage tail spike protein [Paenibacillus dendritiformis]|uniref:phage tail spike protein n=1 Tax=Paenibacillus dendritiformis TaxID=130049 RepID=UPI00387E1D0E